MLLSYRVPRVPCLALCTDVTLTQCGCIKPAASPFAKCGAEMWRGFQITGEGGGKGRMD